MFLISHRCGLQLNRVYNRWIIPKKVMTSGQHSAAETPHKLTVASTGAKLCQRILLYDTGLGTLV